MIEKKSVIFDIGLQTGTVLHETYKLTDYVSIGQTSIVYGAKTLSGERVLVKEFCPYAYANRDLDGKSVVCKSDNLEVRFKQMLACFEHECEILSHLSKQVTARKHARIVGYYDSFHENDTCYLVMEEIKGMDLMEAVTSGKELPYKITIRAMITLVQMVHKEKILHLDLKPSNILVTEEGEYVLIDFGTARFLEEKNQISFASKHYSAPEIYREESCGIETDIYSLGAMIYFLTTGIFVPCAEDRLKEDSLKPVSAYVNIPNILEQAILKCLRLEKKKRLRHLNVLKFLFI